MRSLKLIGQRFGNLMVIDRADSRHGKTQWLTECDCGTRRVVAASSLVTGRTQSCGCYRIDLLRLRQTTHGKSRTPEYRTWRQMNNRCYNQSSIGFHNYGARGITVCERWRDSFDNFLADMGLRPSDKHSLDRINNDGNYESGNCRWATRDEQYGNKRSNRYLTLGGTTRCLAHWAKSLDLHPQALRERLRKGWSLERALTTPALVAWRHSK